MNTDTPPDYQPACNHFAGNKRTFINHKNKKMKAKTVLLIMISLFFLGGTGCEKKESPRSIVRSSAILYFSNPAVDGCGWEIQIAGESFYPTNLSDEIKESILSSIEGYEIRKQKVELEYVVLTTKTKCASAWNSTYFKDIEIIKIEVIN